MLSFTNLIARDLTKLIGLCRIGAELFAPLEALQEVGRLRRFKDPSQGFPIRRTGT